MTFNLEPDRSGRPPTKYAVFCLGGTRNTSIFSGGSSKKVHFVTETPCSMHLQDPLFGHQAQVYFAYPARVPGYLSQLFLGYLRNETLTAPVLPRLFWSHVLKAVPPPPPWRLLWPSTTACRKRSVSWCGLDTSSFSSRRSCLVSGWSSCSHSEFPFFPFCAPSPFPFPFPLSPTRLCL